MTKAAQNNLLPLVAQFVKVALEEISDLKADLDSAKETQAMQTKLAKEKLDKSLLKAAQALYDSDFLTDETERLSFLKSASEDPSYLAKVLEKVCQAADVSQIGRSARAASRPKQAEYDPVAARAFGLTRGGLDLDE